MYNVHAVIIIGHFNYTHNILNITYMCKHISSSLTVVSNAIMSS